MQTSLYQYSENEKIISNQDYQKLLIEEEPIDEEDIRSIWRDLSCKKECPDHWFRFFDTEIRGVFEAYQNLLEKTKKVNGEWKFYKYFDIVAFYSILGNKGLCDKLKEVLVNDKNDKKIISKFRETRNKFFDHRYEYIKLEHQTTAGSNMYVNFFFDTGNNDKSIQLILMPRIDFKQWIRILKKTI